MTFSDAAVVDFVNRNFEAAWTSVAPINDIVVDIGNGRTVRGATNGEIALYVCRPDGKVIDVLPGLHTAQRTLDFLVEAIADKTNAQTWLLVEAGRCLLVLLGGLDLGPGAGQVVHVLLQRAGGLASTHCAHDEAAALGSVLVDEVRSLRRSRSRPMRREMPMWSTVGMKTM